MTCILLCLWYSLFVVELSFLSTVANYLLQSIIYFYSVHQPGPIYSVSMGSLIIIFTLHCVLHVHITLHLI